MRHGATALNDPKHAKLRGFIEAPLAATDTVRASARFLRPLGLHAILASPLERAQDTADIVSHIARVPTLWTNSALRPWNYGELAGMDAKQGLPRLKHLIAHPSVTPQGGEPFDEFMNRWRTGLESLLMHTLAHPDKPLLAITHSRNLYALPRLLTGALKIPVTGPPEPADVLAIEPVGKTFRVRRLYHPQENEV